MIESYSELVKTLDDIKFNQFYLDNISKKKYSLNYGARKGARNFSNVKDVAEQFDYDSDSRYLVNIHQQFNILESNDLEKISDTDIILLCIEIFDWGRVQNYNIIEALDRHRKNELKAYLHSCKRWFESDNNLTFEIKNAIWSSGWTKVYSFMFNKTAIYDSRVSAFINYVLIQFYQTLNDPSDKEIVEQVCSYLVTFKGANIRKRLVGKADREKLSINRLATKKISKNMTANKLSSWLLRYLANTEYGSDSQENFRNLDKTAFMLGFDIIQIDSSTSFE